MTTVKSKPNPPVKFGDTGVRQLWIQSEVQEIRRKMEDIVTDIGFESRNEMPARNVMKQLFELAERIDGLRPQ